MRRRANLWITLLAGGQGTRVARLTTYRNGRKVPKQFWRGSQGCSMLERTLERALRHADPTRIVAVVSEEQRRWWRRPLHRLPDENVLSQPANRGTAVALLHAAVHTLLREPDARIVVLPSDHHFADERVLDEAIARAANAAEAEPEHLVLLGAVPERDEPDLGWILPASGDGPDPRPVERFVEKPEPVELPALRRRGALLNTFVLVFTGWALIHAYQRAVPELFDHYMAALDGGRLQADRVRQAFARLPACDFGRDVLEKATSLLETVTLPPCGWMDLGTPDRLVRWLAQAQAQLAAT